MQSVKYITIASCPCTNLDILLREAFRHPWYTTIVYYSNHHTAAIGNPYGILWWMFYQFFSYGTYSEAILGLTIMDTLFLIGQYKIGGLGRYYWHFLLLDLAIFLTAPVDLLPFWVLSLAVYSPLFIALAGVIKLPFGAPQYVWTFVLSNPLDSSHVFSLANLSNTWRYYLFGTMALVFMMNWVRHRRIPLSQCP
jgi:hypothetical protein